MTELRLIVPILAEDLDPLNTPLFSGGLVASTDIKLTPNMDLFEAIGGMESTALTCGIWARDPSKGDGVATCLGRYSRDGFDNPISYVFAGDLAAVMGRCPSRDRLNRSVLRSLRAFPPHVPVVLLWDLRTPA
jgi:hypothetical protein